MFLLVHQTFNSWNNSLGNSSQTPLGPLVKAKVHPVSCSNPSFFLVYEQDEPKVQVCMSAVQNPPSHAHGHTWGDERVKVDHGNPIALLPSVLGLVVLVPKPLEGNLQQPWSCKKEKNKEVHFFQVSVTDCFPMTITSIRKRSFSINSSDCFMTVFTPSSGGRWVVI